MVMLAQIEDAIGAVLSGAGLNVSPLSSDLPDDLSTAPVVYIATNKARYERRPTQCSVKQTVTVALTVVFKAMDGAKVLRRGIYPVLEGILGLLTLQKLGLALQDPLVPVGFQNVTDDELLAAGVMVFVLEFELSVIVQQVDSETAVDLLRIGLSYNLRPDDGTVDAADEIAFTP